MVVVNIVLCISYLFINIQAVWNGLNGTSPGWQVYLGGSYPLEGEGA